MAELYLPNFVNTLAMADQASARANDQQRQNALAGYYRDNAQDLLAGDQNALAGLAQYDPQAAFGMQRQIQDDQQRAADRAEMRADRLNERNYQRGRDARLDARQSRADDRADQEWQFKLEQHAATLSQQQREAQVAAIEQAVQRGLAIPDAATWDQFMTQNGQPDLVGQFDNRESIARGYMTIAEQLKGMQPAAPMSGPGRVQADINAGYLPEGTPLRGEAPQTVIDMGGNSSAFTKKSDELAATRLGDVVTDGQNAGRLIGDLQALAGLAGQINTGKGAELMTRFGPYAEMAGISIDGLSEMQSYQAIVDRLAPAMRPPGSGGSSDFDAKQFLSSLPSLARTPEGNAIINETLQSVQRQKLAAADIAMQAQRGEITWQEADKKMAALGNPYETFNKMKDKISGGASQAPQVGEVRKGYRFKGGDPADQANWEKQ
ncbi:hypothetical protein [Paracoccus sp. KR1-242]|uniref:hypothetical protein n=1 Tax=Paracoccus sp. KR1-242 TaxID=3410028 RepID=UPI003C0244E5